MSSDWLVWPIFVAQFFSFMLVFLPISKGVLGLKPPYLICLLLLGTCFAILFSLWHDSTDALHLYF